MKEFIEIKIIEESDTNRYMIGAIELTPLFLHRKIRVRFPDGHEYLTKLRFRSKVVVSSYGTTRNYEEPYITVYFHGLKFNTLLDDSFSIKIL